MRRVFDPKDKKAAERHAEAQRRANSFAAVAEEFIARHVHKLRTGREVEAMIRRELIERWGPKPIVEIGRREIVEALEAISDSGRPYAAHKVYNYIPKLFSWVIVRGMYGIEFSPCMTIKPNEIIGTREARRRKGQGFLALGRAGG